MKEVVRETLLELGFDYTDMIIFNHSAKKLQGLVNFNLACYYARLKLKWGRKQIQAFLEMLNQLNYMAVTLKSQWAFIKKLAQIQRFEITECMDDHFDHILAKCRPFPDDKMPVSQKLLVELLSVSEQTFQEYNVALFQAMILTAWGTCMRISEYSFTRAHLPDHNVRCGAVFERVVS